MGTIYWGIEVLTSKPYSQTNMPFTRLVEIVIPNGVFVVSLILFSIGCLLANFIHYDLARKNAKHFLSASCLITVGSFVIRLAT